MPIMRRQGINPLNIHFPAHVINKLCQVTAAIRPFHNHVECVSETAHLGGVDKLRDRGQIHLLLAAFAGFRSNRCFRNRRRGSGPNTFDDAGAVGS